MDLKVHAQFVARTTLQRIFRAGNVGSARRTVALDRNAHPAFAKFVTAEASCAQTKSSLAPFQVRDTHAGKQNTGEFLRGKSHGHANHRTENASFAQPVPERYSPAHAFDSRASKRDRVLTNLPTALRSLNLGRGQVGKVVAEIPGEKIVDVVLAGVHAGHKCRPRHRRNGWECGLQFLEGPSLAQLREIRQFAFGNESLGQFRIHAVKPENDGTFDLCFSVSLASPQQAK